MCNKVELFKRKMGDLNFRDYELIPIQIGCEVRGIDLKTYIKPEVISQIKDDLIKHRLLLFKNQKLSGDRHVELSSYFGNIESELKKHPNSPHPHILRMSNHSKNGITGIVNDEWHIDGTGDIPYLYTFYHAVSVDGKNSICFSPMDDLVENLDLSKKSEFEGIWVEFDKNVLPFVIRHPLSKNQTLCLNPSMTSGLISALGTDEEKRLTNQKQTEIMKSILDEFFKNNHLNYEHQWEEGDFIMVDNLALAHKIPNFPTKNFLMHRVSVKDDTKPGK